MFPSSSFDIEQMRRYSLNITEWQSRLGSLRTISPNSLSMGDTKRLMPQTVLNNTLSLSITHLQQSLQTLLGTFTARGAEPHIKPPSEFNWTTLPTQSQLDRCHRAFETPWDTTGLETYVSTALSDKVYTNNNWPNLGGLYSRLWTDGFHVELVTGTLVLFETSQPRGITLQRLCAVVASFAADEMEKSRLESAYVVVVQWVTQIVFESSADDSYSSAQLTNQVVGSPPHLMLSVYERQSQWYSYQSDAPKYKVFFHKNDLQKGYGYRERVHNVRGSRNATFPRSVLAALKIPAGSMSRGILSSPTAQMKLRGIAKKTLAYAAYEPSMLRESESDSEACTATQVEDALNSVPAHVNIRNSSSGVGFCVATPDGILYSLTPSRIASLHSHTLKEELQILWEFMKDWRRRWQKNPYAIESG